MVSPLDHETINERLDRLEVAQAQNFEPLNMRLEHIETKLNMIYEQVNFITKVLSRRFAGLEQHVER